MHALKSLILASAAFALPVVLPACGSTGARGTAPAVVNHSTELRMRFDHADALFVNGEFEDALEAYSGLYDVVRGDAALVAESSAQIASTLARLGRVDESDVWMKRAEAGANDSEPRSWTRVLLARALRAYHRYEPDLARGTLVSLYNYCFNHDLTPRAVEAADLAAKASLGQEQLDWSTRAIQAAQSVGDARQECRLWVDHAAYLERTGRHADALTAYEHARAVAAGGKLPRFEDLRTDWAYGHGLRMVGQLDEAREVLSEANAVGQGIYAKYPSPLAAEFLGRVIAELGYIDAMVGDKERARVRFDSAIQKLTEAGPIPNARAAVESLRTAIEELDAPPPLRRIPAKNR